MGRAEVAENSVLVRKARYDSKIGAIEFQGCEIKDAQSLIHRKAQCAQFVVPEDYRHPDRATLKLRVVRIKANAKTAQPDPVVLIAGGPGQSAVEGFNPGLGQLMKIRFARDIYLIDQRGTGESNPLDCPDIKAPLEFETGNRKSSIQKIV